MAPGFERRAGVFPARGAFPAAQSAASYGTGCILPARVAASGRGQQHGEPICATPGRLDPSRFALGQFKDIGHISLGAGGSEVPCFCWQQ